MEGVTTYDSIASGSHESHPDGDVHALVRAGDVQSAFRLLMKRYGEDVYRLCLRALNDKALAEDVRQQVFLEAFRDLRRFACRSTMRTWLLAIARHRVLDELKMRRRARAHILDSEPRELAELSDSQPSPAESVDSMRMLQALAASLDNLDGDVRAAILLRFHRGLSYDEMAELCGEQSGTMHARVSRALHRLRKEIESRIEAPFEDAAGSAGARGHDRASNLNDRSVAEKAADPWKRNPVLSRYASMKNMPSRSRSPDSSSQPEGGRDASKVADPDVTAPGGTTKPWASVLRRDAPEPSSRSGARRRRAKRHGILFLAANPHGGNLLKLGEECAEIQRELRMTANRDEFYLESRWAVGIDELMRHLMELEPTVLHFSGHGGGNAGLMFQDQQGQPQPVSARALAMMVTAAARSVRVVVLNACYSAVQASALRTTVDCVVGMDGVVGDDAARAFATRFYGALGNRKSIGNAVAQGVAALAARQLPDELLPRCMTRDGINADDIILGRLHV